MFASNLSDFFASAISASVVLLSTLAASTKSVAIASLRVVESKFGRVVSDFSACLNA